MLPLSGEGVSQHRRTWQLAKNKAGNEEIIALKNAGPRAEDLNLIIPSALDVDSSGFVVDGSYRYNLHGQCRCLDLKRPARALLYGCRSILISHQPKIRYRQYVLVIAEIPTRAGFNWKGPLVVYSNLAMALCAADNERPRTEGCAGILVIGAGS